MRRVLGLTAEPQKHATNRDADHQTPRQRPHDPFSADRRKRRFVQDGEVPVVLMNARRDHGGDTAYAGGPSRLEIAEAAVVAERTARERAERSLQEARATIRDLQTKQAHAELAANDAQAAREAMRSKTAEIESLRESLSEQEEQLAVVEAARAALDQTLHSTRAALAAERLARAAADRTMAEALDARDAAEKELARRIELFETLPVVAPEPAPRARRAAAGVKATKPKARTAKPESTKSRAAATATATSDREKAAKRAKPSASAPKKPAAAVMPAARDAKPVRWWLKTSPKPGRPTATLKVPTRR